MPTELMEHKQTFRAREVAYRTYWLQTIENRFGLNQKKV